MGTAVLPAANGSPLIVLQFAGLSRRTAAMIRGGLNDTCDTPMTVAAQ